MLRPRPILRPRCWSTTRKSNSFPSAARAGCRTTDFNRLQENAARSGRIAARRSACRAAPNRGGSITGKWARARRRRFPRCASPGRRLIEDGAIRDIRIALGSVAPIVLRAVKTEDALRGQSVTPDGHRRGTGHSRARNRADRRHSLDRALSPARRAKSARRISFAARPMKTIHAIRSKRVVTPEGVRRRRCTFATE